MNIRKATLTLLLAVSAAGLAQENTQKDSVAAVQVVPTPEVKISYLDSIKATFVHDQLASCVDSLWMKELTNVDIFDDIQSDIKNFDPEKKVVYDELPTELLKQRLKEMDAKSPFNIEYNPGLENLIKNFLKNRKRSYERLMAISEYYFPMFEEAMARKNVPLEIKYLAIVESALNPKAVSRVGATGLWQFMYQTGKQYNLKIDSYVDERSDPLKASEAAAQYMANMYRIFGDWDLVLASYNSGPGNVAKAIRRSGGQQNFWNIRRNLPKETQGYVPAFLATMYIYEYHKEHGIVPNRALVKHFETDTVMVRRQISFKQISDLLDIPVAQLQLLNPSYKLNTVPAYNDAPHYLRLPNDKMAIFTSNEDKIYAYCAHEELKRERPFKSSSLLASRDSTRTKSDSTTRTKYYKVRRGDSLSEIAEKYDVSVASLKKWNRLKSNKAPMGKSLRIVTTEAVAVKPQVVKPTSQDVASVEVKEVKKAKEDTDTTATTRLSQVYVVQAGDNLSSIARRFNVSVDDIKKWNDLHDNNVKLDSKLTIAQLITENTNDAAVVDNQPKTQEYVVAKGDNLSAIARKYGITLNELKEMNNLTENSVLLGTKLTVPAKTDVEDTAVAEAAAKTKKERIAAVEKKKSEHYYVKKGDSLFSIAKKYPGVSISDIKKWNGINGSNLKPGMKLKISGT
ncbi:LysM peptidoglycan-binding domain-containing protein [Flavobacterium silvaticum]|uniref:LysM peptidoglycan-binding domain-containing protein n=1 Tax=Flavobacterium silvaticum TaxID=1852020 RepID=A0A972FUS3_9FLAO|nr:LysM peptidoglycan-binding domain-containing protein [Flavobacterium silvaticum]NMH28432.1 LysM peptidoglycan-binding domain-containing protein [Flavobacterium silvaticum]